MYIENMDSLSSLMSLKRHYKKDSRYVNDLYTLTYDNHESLYTTNELISLHFTMNANDVEVENVSFVDTSVGMWARKNVIMADIACPVGLD